MVIYMTTNLINNTKYIGADTCNNPKYLGSGKLLLKAIKKYGRCNFKKEILEYCTSTEHVRDREIYWIRYYNADQSAEFYNLAYGGQGGVKGAIPWNKGMSIKNNPELYQKMFVEAKPCDYSYRTDDWKLDHSNRIKNSKKFQANKDIKIETRKNNGNPWHSEETKKKMSLAKLGKTVSPESVKKRSETLKSRGSLTGGKNGSALKVKATNTIDNTIMIFDCVKDAYEYYNCSRFHICNRGRYHDTVFEVYDKKTGLPKVFGN
jgi:group I intron endonuclease